MASRVDERTINQNAFQGFSSLVSFLGDVTQTIDVRTCTLLSVRFQLRLAERVRKAYVTDCVARLIAELDLELPSQELQRIEQEQCQIPILACASSASPAGTGTARQTWEYRWST